MNSNKKLVNKKSKPDWYTGLNKILNQNQILKKLIKYVIIVALILSSLFLVVTIIAFCIDEKFKFILFISVIIFILCLISLIVSKINFVDQKLCKYISSYSIWGIILPIAFSTIFFWIFNNENIELIVATICSVILCLCWCVYNVKHAKDPKKDYAYIQLVLQIICGILTVGGMFYNELILINHLYIIFLTEYLLLPLYVQYKIMYLTTKSS